MFSMPKLFSRNGCLQPTLSMDDTHSLPSLSQEVRLLFEKFSSNGRMHASHFCKFLNEVQHEVDVSEAEASEIMTSYLGSSSDHHFTRELFLRYLFDTKLNFAINTKIHHDMNLPLSHYYIFTGHNSYLTGNQLNSECSEKPIIEALLKGVRVVELDLWPNEKDICVKHGGVWTPPVQFQKCIAAIKETAFQKSKYPVVITLEDHLSADLQAKAAKIITDTFGSQLYHPPPGEELKQFPSPEQLKEKILISTKPPKKYLQCNGNGKAKQSDQETPAEEPNAESDTGQGSESLDQSSDEEDDGACDEANRPPEQRNINIVSEDYVKIIAIRQGRKGKPLLKGLRVEEHAKRISLSEPQVSKFAESNVPAAVEFTHNNILRIYPKGMRVFSSNYNPYKAWLLGAQMVALNMQGYDKHLWIAQGFFRANGGCGYVKKPSFLMSEVFDPRLDFFNPKSTALEVKQNLKVKVCMGKGWLEQLGEKSFDKSSPPDFYTRVGIAGARADKVMERTAVIKDSWEPIWDHEFQFMLRVPELAVLRIEVKEDNKTVTKFAGQIYLPVSELKSGYRVVPLCDEKGNEWELVKLLLHLTLSTGIRSWRRRRKCLCWCNLI